MDTDLGEDISNAEMALNRFQSDANIEAIVEELNPETFGVPLDNPHLDFFGVNPQQYAAQLGTQPSADWKERIRAIIAGFRQNVRLPFRLEDFLLEEDDPEIVALLDYHRGQAQIAEAERKGNKVASKKRKVDAFDVGGDLISEWLDFLEEEEEDDREAEVQDKGVRKAAYGEGWIKRAKKQASHPKRKADQYEWVHPTENPLRHRYADDDVTFQSFTYREKDLVLHNDRVRPIKPTTTEEFVDVCEV